MYNPQRWCQIHPPINKHITKEDSTMQLACAAETGSRDYMDGTAGMKQPAAFQST